MASQRQRLVELDMFARELGDAMAQAGTSPRESGEVPLRNVLDVCDLSQKTQQRYIDALLPVVSRAAQAFDLPVEHLLIGVSIGSIAASYCDDAIRRFKREQPEPVTPPKPPEN